MIPSPICFRGNLKPRTGYGTIPENLGRAIEAMGYRVTYDDYGQDQHTHRLTPFVAARMHGSRPAPCVIHCTPPDIPFDTTDPTICLTMWETTGLPANALPLMARARAIAVPSRWGAECFKAAGVTIPIHVVPLGLDSCWFAPSPVAMDGPTVFGMAARLVAGGCRKGINEGMHAFADAFPALDEPVELRIRVWEDDLPYLDSLPDPRIQVQIEPVEQPELAAWYRGLTCLLVPSKGEGFGLHTLEAMACGRPVIAAHYSGTAEFFDSRSGWYLTYDMEPAGGLYAGCGDWAVPRTRSMINALRIAHDMRQLCAAKGQYAAKAAAEWTWERSASSLLSVIDTTFSLCEAG